MKQTWKPIMAGILDIVAGAIGMVGGIALAMLKLLFDTIDKEVLRFNPQIIQPALIKWVENMFSALFAVPFVLVFIGIISIIGGVYALQRRIWIFALAGSISSCVAFPFFGIPSVVITSLAKDEFN
ncbi:MAG: hypothetical protein ACYDHZ_10540 [Dehalococcoidia bacterium]